GGVCELERRALYLARPPIPWSRAGERPEQPRRHVDLYAYRVRDLKALSAEPASALEIAERLEQIPALWLGMRIVVADANVPPARGVDTPAELEAIRADVAAGRVISGG